MPRKKNYQVPYRADGSIQGYAEWGNWGEVTWRDPEPFEATLVLTGHERGRSAAHFIMKNDKTGATYVVFMVDLFEMVKDTRWIAGSIKATFEPCKRGTNYGVRLVDD